MKKYNVWYLECIFRRLSKGGGVCFRVENIEIRHCNVLFDTIGMMCFRPYLIYESVSQKVYLSDETRHTTTLSVFQPLWQKLKLQGV